MGGGDDGNAAKAQVAGEPQAQMTGGGGSNNAAKMRADYKAALAERDARIKELEGEIAEAAKTAESAEKMRKKTDKQRHQGEEQRVGFEPQMAGARNVKAARALLSDYDNDIDKLKAAESWLFGADSSAPAQTGATGLPNKGAATDKGAKMQR